jgi:DNA gyrase/topoisomerase IV subunit A
MFPPEKIEEWLNEVTQRPASATLIIQFIANRLAELSKWNEKLREENIALRTGQRVQEYEQQISHLEYQLELLKRQVGGEIPAQVIAMASPAIQTINLLISDSHGRILRLPLNLAELEDGISFGNLEGLPQKGEPPRLLVVTSNEELICVFTSGRIQSIPASSIPLGTKEAEWEQVAIPIELAVGDSLASLMPATKMALADFFVQVSRRGFMKKIRMALAPSIMENRYIGTGTKLPGDQTLEIGLGHDNDLYALLSWEGYLQCVTASMLSFAVEEAVRLNQTDHLVAAFPYKPDQSIVAMTQIGKVIHRTTEGLEIAEDLQRRGRVLYSKERREKGIRVVGGAAVHAQDWGLALHRDGKISLHAMSALFDSGTIPVEGELLAFIAFSGIKEPTQSA